MGLETTKGSSCRGSIHLWPALRMLICGRQTTRVPGMEAWLWYQLRTVPGMSPQMMVLGEGRLSFGRNMQQDCSSNCRGERTVRTHLKPTQNVTKTRFYWINWNIRILCWTVFSTKCHMHITISGTLRGQLNIELSPLKSIQKAHSNCIMSYSPFHQQREIYKPFSQQPVARKCMSSVFFHYTSANLI